MNFIWITTVHLVLPFKWPVGISGCARRSNCLPLQKYPDALAPGLGCMGTGLTESWLQRNGSMWPDWLGLEHLQNSCIPAKVHLQSCLVYPTPLVVWFGSLSAIQGCGYDDLGTLSILCPWVVPWQNFEMKLWTMSHPTLLSQFPILQIAKAVAYMKWCGLSFSGPLAEQMHVGFIQPLYWYSSNLAWNLPVSVFQIIQGFIYGNGYWFATNYVCLCAFGRN